MKNRIGSTETVGDPTGSCWQVFGASVVGSAHLREDTPCQDANGWKLLPGGCAVFAIADGAGSASHADIGAKLAVERSIDAIAATVASHASGEQIIPDEGWPAAMREIVAAVREAVVSRALEANLRPRDFACTLIISVLAPSAVVTAHVGDGAVVVRHRDGTLETLSAPEQSEYANEVNFLTAQNALDHLRISIIKTELDAIALLTDGLQFSVLSYPDWKPKAEFFTSLLGALAASGSTEAAQDGLRWLLGSDQVKTRTSDDVTLVVGFRRISRDSP